MIDYHCHLLPGLDDGPATVGESLVMAKALAGFGFREVCCTPHCIKGHYEYPPVAVRAAVAELQAALDGAGIPLRLQPGMEYYLDGCFEAFVDDLQPLGDSRLVLCEAPPQVYPEMVAELTGLIVARGYTPLIAHPERSEVIWTLLEKPMDDPELPVRLPVEERRNTVRAFLSGMIGRRSRPVGRPQIPGSRELPATVLFQANLGSFVGFYGPQPQRRAYHLLRRGIYSCFASDLHEGRNADEFLQAVNEKVAANPILSRLGEFTPLPQPAIDH